MQRGGAGGEAGGGAWGWHAHVAPTADCSLPVPNVQYARLARESLAMDLRLGRQRNRGWASGLSPAPWPGGGGGGSLTKIPPAPLGGEGAGTGPGWFVGLARDQAEVGSAITSGRDPDTTRNSLKAALLNQCGGCATGQP